MKFYCSPNGAAIQGNRSPNILKCQCLESWNPEEVETNADTSNTELFFRIIHSANQLSIHGVVSKWCEEFGLKFEERRPKFADKEKIPCIEKC